MPLTEQLQQALSAAKQKTAHYDEYAVDGSSDEPIFLTVYAGATGQAAVTDIYLENAPIVSGREGAIEGQVLGSNSALNGKFMDVYTIVTDIPGPPDTTSFRIELSGGQHPYHFAMEKAVVGQGDSVVYKVTIFFSIN